jgi:hypothetical protein
LSVAARARKKRFSLWRQAYWCQNWWPIFGHTHGWLKKDQVKKNVRFTTVATTFLEPKNPCWSIVGVTIGAVPTRRDVFVPCFSPRSHPVFPGKRNGPPFLRPKKKGFGDRHVKWSFWSHKMDLKQWN